ncbi:DeoR/GlpR family DNA-binding transcription regulator [Stappia stellulata]|uniref:DeoR/GlpR family DNA-binding transcription regulator n=1 Tax=Stappia stellulata TaxID=71235 RepID=UPI000419C5C7|nr:DeoR/GlpR family DNA-binding transcription regulator [Stappia stellulata]
MFATVDITPRQRDIADLVQSDGFASVEGLARRFGVTTQTIRRDLTQLCRRGILRRTHGGVEPPAQSGNLHYARRQILNLAAKCAIAEAVAEDICDGDALAFSIGTTPEIVMQALVHRKNLRIFTNNLHVAFAASQCDSFEVTIAGGRLRHGDCDILGADTRRFFSGYKVDIGIFGVAGVDADGTLLDFHEDEVAARQAILENCRKAYLVLDGSKFGRPAHVRGGHITDVAAVVCDRQPPETLARQLLHSGTRVIVRAETSHSAA